jgi:beta-galactosidase
MPAKLALRFLFLILSAVAVFSANTAPDSPSRQRVCFDRGWRFSLGHAHDDARDFGHATGYFSYLAKTGFGDGAAARSFDDRAWRVVDLPHDWAVELPFDPRGTASHGFKALGHLFPENNIGWYRKTFSIPESDHDRRIHLQFDGIYRAARIFVNGFFIGEEPSGYLGNDYDITDYVRYGEDNVVAVRVDATMEEGWYYEGAGIYRHVWLVTTAPVHVAHDGTWVRTEIGENSAVATIETTVVNEGLTGARCEISHSLLAPDGKQVADSSSAPLNLAGASSTVVDRQEVRITEPQLWSIENPRLYKLVTIVRSEGREIDRYETPFGLRSLRFDPNAGFFLNGKRVELKGTNNHQDFAGVGVAMPDALQEYRVKLLKEMGSNAWRCSHNPPNKELLEACDRLGMLVIDENRLMGSSPWHFSQVERMIRRDRNHPSVILWSIGNEEWAIEGNVFGARIAATLQSFVNRIEPTRPVTAAISGGWGGISSVVQAAGVNYIKQAKPDKQHADFPNQIILGTEETTTQQTRGIYFTDTARTHLAPQEDGSSGGNAELGWKYYQARPWAAGLFYWTGFDYRGEPTPFGWPATLSQFGILDSCGFPKDGHSYLKSWWTDEPVLHVFPHWNWPDRLGEELTVTANSNCDEVELFLNGTSLGRKTMPKNGHLEWKVRYAPGTLLARGFRNGNEIIRDEVVTTGAPQQIRLIPDRHQLRADGQDVVVVRVEIADAAGHVVPTADCPVRFSVKGPGRIIGVGNSNPSCLEPDRVSEKVRSIPVGKWTPPSEPFQISTVHFEAVFDRPALEKGETLSLLLNSFGACQSVTLNGQPLYIDADPEKARCEIVLDAAQLLPKGNVLKLETSGSLNREPLLQALPAVFKITRAAPEWRRSSFNGLALVIIQTTEAPGEITLRAENETAPGTAELTVRSQ